MKTRTIALISITLLATLLIGSIAISTLTGAKELKLKVKWVPRVYEKGNPLPNPWNAQVYFAPLRPVEEINCSTLQLTCITHGGHAPIGPCTVLTNNRLQVPFSGWDVLHILYGGMGHMAPGEYRIYLEITGKLKYSGTTFKGSGGINFVVPNSTGP